MEGKENTTTVPGIEKNSIGIGTKKEFKRIGNRGRRPSPTGTTG
jgi:hypothetical protein